MLAHLDAPTSDIAIEPLDFTVTGWLRRDEGSEVAVIEVTADGILAGTGAEFYARPDVNQSLGLPESTPTGFYVRCRHPAPAAAEGQITIAVRARLQDGTAVVIGREDGVTVPLVPLAAAPLSRLLKLVPADALGLEIGAHVNPTPGLAPFYADADAMFAGVNGRVDLLADATALPLPTGALDYLCSSHVFEHLANPVAALLEWHRVLRPGGLLYLVVPDKRHTFDRSRETTPPLHLLRDFRQQMDAFRSADHVREFVYRTDWTLLQPTAPRAEWTARKDAAYASFLAETAAGRPADIHFHTFTPDSLRNLLRAAAFIDGKQPLFEVLAEAERYPASRLDGIALLLRRRGDHPRATSATFALSRSDGRSPSLPLVCPLTLQRLSAGTDAAVPGLSTPDGRHVYPIVAGTPSLLSPQKHGRPDRPWASRIFRNYFHWCACRRLSSLGTS